MYQTLTYGNQTTVKVVEAVLNKAPIGKLFKKDAKQVTEHLTNLTECELEELEKIPQ